MSEQLLTAIITFALNIPIFAIVVIFWTQLNKRRMDIEKRTGMSLDILRTRIGLLERTSAVYEERMFWMQEISETKLNGSKNKKPTTGN
jgi:hypothetical protein